jgi:multimeric flavodoxin WrbA
MNVVAINGSPRKNGNTTIALAAMAEELQSEGITTEIIQVGDKLIHGCMHCGHCLKSEHNLCLFKEDPVNEVMLKMRAADGLIVGSPTYYAGIAGTLKCFLDRAFFASGSGGAFRNKPAAAVAAVRRAGGVDVYNQLNNYFNLAEMVTPPSQYWVLGYGMNKGEIAKDSEGMQTIRRNANALAWLLKAFAAAKDSVAPPRVDARAWMNFIR